MTAGTEGGSRSALRWRQNREWLAAIAPLPKHPSRGRTGLRLVWAEGEVPLLVPAGTLEPPQQSEHDGTAPEASSADR